MPLSLFSEWHGIYINEIDIEKEDIIKNILSVCNDMGVSFHKKVKTDKWKADIVVDYRYVAGIGFLLYGLLSL